MSEYYEKRRDEKMIDYDKIILTYQEHFLLFHMRFIKTVSDEFLGDSADILLEYGLIVPNYDAVNDLGSNCFDGTYRLSDTYKRFRKYSRRQTIHRYLTPITVSAATTVVLHILQQWWLPVISDWLRGLL